MGKYEKYTVNSLLRAPGAQAVVEGVVLVKAVLYASHKNTFHEI